MKKQRDRARTIFGVLSLQNILIMATICWAGFVLTLSQIVFANTYRELLVLWAVFFLFFIPCIIFLFLAYNIFKKLKKEKLNEEANETNTTKQ